MSGSIEVRGLSRTFHTTVRRPGLLGAVRSLVNPERVAKEAVRDISFEVAAGELLALLGPNGAGKSTTIKMLTGILTPSAGEARVAGVVPYEERERNARNIGAVFGQRTQLWWDLPVRESFAILRDIYEVPKAEHAARLKEFDELLDLSSFWDTRVRHLSLGQRVRSDLAAALLHDPPVVFLDEPTIGMDVVVKEQVREFLRYQVTERGRTVLLTTHDMTEVERLAERVVLINHGRLVLDGSLDEIRRSFGSTWQVRATLADAHADVTALPGIAVLRRDGPQVVFGPDGSEAPTVHQALKAVIERYEVTGVAIDEADLEDVMRAAYVQAGPVAEPVAEGA
ncbi:ABC transporter ATP-binding protein [Streptomyces bluensis]|uniref:ATP-binding cassette domain-containing protein n=1 Tax=Streptomyces bluensis TaxID=33897 RepID=A0ABW6UFE3_9ACTN|nr:ATP-binding cassette domain-containing protein [Streptomyces bluensis]GGZ78556.1 ABC transporter ATP-binding protein [Streptomyces bluensis]